MKYTFAFIVFFSPLTFAQMPMNPQNMGNMQGMMEQMQKMEACMANVDESYLERWSEKADQKRAAIDNLCRSGKKGQALEMAKEFSQEMKNDKEVNKMRQCMSMAMGMMPPMPFAEMEKELENENASVCSY